MHRSCDYCGVEVGTDMRGRFYPEDDSLLCEECFPVPDKKVTPAAGPAEKLPRAVRLAVTAAEEAGQAG